MPCSSCQSSNQMEFPSEINIHFPGPKNFTTPTVWVFPEHLGLLRLRTVRTFTTPKTIGWLAAGTLTPNRAVA